ncbi:MAG TPA: exodeoxyribonuclease III [Candidatus Bathyarchaeia archaeon]|nr:exodeoxyribonuclease III [Candidatus Bathyarchaeia archaeon]
MKEYKLISWNVNGIRAMLNKKIFQEKDFSKWMKAESPDVLCLQETKAQPEQLSEEILNLEGYHSFWNSAETKGYSGVVIFTKEKPIEVSTQLGKDHLDSEGRHIIAEYSKFVIINSYFPNGKKDDERLRYKMEYYEVFLNFINKLREKGKSIIFCGDVNTAHKPIDLTHPKANETISGFLPIEREWLDKVIEQGYIDSFRYFYPDVPEKYTWWSVRSIGAREKNVGWRLDYFFVSKDLVKNLSQAYILNDVYGSDHCPVGLRINI